MLDLSLFTHHDTSKHYAALPFQTVTSLEGLPCNDIQKIYQSPDGYIWLASKNGFYRYDGYSFKTYKSNLYHPTLLSNNNILCLEEDIENRLWIGTDKGLNVFSVKPEKSSKSNVRIY